MNSLGGRRIAVACDLSVDEEIRSFFERVRQESGHLNILVNNAAYLNEKMFVRPFWEAPVELANVIDVGLRCHHVATSYAASLLIAQRRGLIVNISFYANAKVHDPAYYASKAGLDKIGRRLCGAFHTSASAYAGAEQKSITERRADCDSWLVGLGAAGR